MGWCVICGLQHWLGIDGWKEGGWWCMIGTWLSQLQSCLPYMEFIGSAPNTTQYLQETVKEWLGK